MTHRRIQFSNRHHLLTEDERLSGLRARVDDIASDLEALEAMSPDERREAAELRASVLDKFYRLGEA